MVIRWMQQFPRIEFGDYAGPQRQQLKPTQSQIRHLFHLFCWSRLFKCGRYLSPIDWNVMKCDYVDEWLFGVPRCCNGPAHWWIWRVLLEFRADAPWDRPAEEVDSNCTAATAMGRNSSNVSCSWMGLSACHRIKEPLPNSKQQKKKWFYHSLQLKWSKNCLLWKCDRSCRVEYVSSGPF